MGTRNVIERRFRDTIKVKFVTGASNSGSFTYGSETTISKCRIEEGFFESIDSKGQEIKSKTEIINYETQLPEGTLITEINGSALTKPKKIRADSKIPSIRYDEYLYTGWL